MGLAGGPRRDEISTAAVLGVAAFTVGVTEEGTARATARRQPERTQRFLAPARHTRRPRTHSRTRHGSPSQVASQSVRRPGTAAHARAAQWPACGSPHPGPPLQGTEILSIRERSRIATAVPACQKTHDGSVDSLESVHCTNLKSDLDRFV